MRVTTIVASILLVLLMAAQPVVAAGMLALVKDIYPGDSADPNLLMAAGNRVYFAADDGIHGRELWSSDGTEDGTMLMVDALAGSKSANPEPIGAVGNVLYFDDKDSIHGHELWRTDGTPAGTHFVKNITPGKSGTDFGGSIALDGKLLFFANSSLYTTDGTAGNTKPIGPAGLRFVLMGNRAYFLSGSSNLDFRVWRTDGTAAGTKQVGWSPAGVNYLASTTDRLYILANSDEVQSGPAKLWVSDGTSAGTLALTTDGALTHPSGLRAAGSKAFLLDQPPSGAVLWRSNGTVAGTKAIASLPGTPSNIYSQIGLVFIPVNVGGNSWQMWTSYGTIGSTFSIASFTSQYGPEEWAALGGTAYFTAIDYDSDTWTLWQTNGHAAGTAPAVSSGPADGYPFEIQAAADKLIFSADDGVTGREIWKYQP